MTVQQARVWLVAYSLVACGTTIVFFLIAPATTYPLGWDDSFRILEIITPVFFGYLGLATRNIFAPRTARDVEPYSSSLFRMLLLGPLSIFGIVVVTLVVAFYLTNRTHEDASRAMSVDVFAAGITLALSLFTVTTNVIAARIFGETTNVSVNATEGNQTQ